MGFYKPHRFTPLLVPFHISLHFLRTAPHSLKLVGLTCTFCVSAPFLFVCLFPGCIAKSVPFISIFPVPWSLHLFPSILINSYMKRAAQYVCFRNINVVCTHSRTSTGNWIKTRPKWIARWTLYENTSASGTSAWSLLESTVLFCTRTAYKHTPRTALGGYKLCMRAWGRVYFHNTRNIKIASEPVAAGASAARWRTG